MLYTTASTLIAVLAYIDPNTTPKIAYDNDQLAIPLINKLKETIGDKDGSQQVYLSFGQDEADLQNQFSKIVANIADIFSTIKRVYDI
jgi:hypothetical protein